MSTAQDLSERTEVSPSASRQNSPIVPRQEGDVNVETIKDTEDGETQDVSTMDPSSSNSASEDRPVKPWVEIFTSPCEAAFSPSKDPSKQRQNSDNLHGLAIQLASDRARQLNRGNRRFLNILVEVANLYDQYAQSLVKAGQTLQPAITVHLPVLSIQESLVSWSGEISKLASVLRTAVAQPLQAYLVTHADVVAGMQQRYLQSRQKSFQHRQRAIHARNKYVKVLRETEKAIVEWREKMEDDEKKETSSDDVVVVKAATTPSKPNKRIASKLRDVQRLEAQYKRCVQRENECVKTCQRLESMALETMQTLDEDRLVIFVHSLIKILVAEKEALDEMAISLEKELGDDKQETVVADRKGRKKFANLLKKSYSASQFDEGAGVMDADTLGLPEEIGQLRDQVTSRIAARAARVQVAKTLSIFLENMASAAAKLGAGLKYQLRNNSPHSMRDIINSCEGHRTVSLLDGLIKLLGQEAEGALALAASLRNVRTEKLDNTILYGERSLKTVADTDDAMWKQLCDAARRQTKAESRYRESTAESAKARVRVQSMDDSESGQSGMLVHKHVSQGIANMLSILPDGGEQAMKMLDSGTRASFAQRSLEEADENEKKLRLALDSAMEGTSRSLEAYKSNAEALSSHYEEEEKEGWTDLRYSLEQFVTQVESLRQSLRGTLSEVEPMLEFESSLKSVSSDAKEWVQDVQKQIAAKTAQPELEADAGSGFMLTVSLEQSKNVDEMLGGLGENEVEIVLNDEDADDEDIDEINPEDPGNAPTSGPGPDDSTAISSVSDAADDSQSHQWLRRRLHSTGSIQKTTSFRGKLSLPKNLLRRRTRAGSNQLDFETEIFLTYFWPDSADPEHVPAVVTSFACSFRDGSQPLPFQYGRLYLTLRRMVFVSWTGKKLNLKWPDVLDVKGTKKFIGSDEDNLVVTCRKKGVNEESYMLLGGIANHQQSLADIEKVREDAKSAQEEAADAAALDESARGLAEVPPDNTLQRMEVVLSKHIHHISVQRFYEVVWSEGNGTDEKPLYGPWLAQECFDIEVGDWELSEAVGPWCNERYSQKRSVKFKVKRKSHLYIGPPIATVLQTHYCRVEGNDKCVLGMTIGFDGVPYGDCFNVEVRWVARREGTNDILVQVGLFVDFKKSTLLKSKIRSGTIEESTPVHRNLFKFAKAACIAARGEEVTKEEVEEEEAEEAEEEMMKKPEAVGGFMGEIGFDSNAMIVCGAFLLLVILWRFFSRFRGQVEVEESPAFSSEEIAFLSQRMDRLESEIKSMHATLQEVLVELKNRNN